MILLFLDSMWKLRFYFIKFVLFMFYKSAPRISHTDLEQTQGILKGESGLFFGPCVNAMAWRPYCPSCMEASYCTFGFGTFIRRDLRTLSLPRDSPRDHQYACVIWVHAGKATHASWNYLAGLATKKSGGTITLLHTWWQDGRHNRFPL